MSLPIRKYEVLILSINVQNITFQIKHFFSTTYCILSAIFAMSKYFDIDNSGGRTDKGTPSSGWTTRLEGSIRAATMNIYFPYLYGPLGICSSLKTGSTHSPRIREVL